MENLEVLLVSLRFAFLSTERLGIHHLLWPFILVVFVFILQNLFRHISNSILSSRYFHPTFYFILFVFENCSSVGIMQQPNVLLLLLVVKSVKSNSMYVNNFQIQLQLVLINKNYTYFVATKDSLMCVHKLYSNVISLYCRRQWLRIKVGGQVCLGGLEIERIVKQPNVRDYRKQSS